MIRGKPRKGVTMNILVVEDERNLADAICHILEEDGYKTEAAYDGTTGLAYAESGLYDAVILDVMLPGMDGFEIVRKLRKDSHDLPVMMLTAKTSTADKVTGLDCGADDYMTKPFEADELLARMRALTRRTGGVVLDELTFGDLTLDLTDHDLSCADRGVHLSQREFEVMRMLMASPGRIVSKRDLICRVWGTGAETTDNCAEAYVSFLRKKLTHLRSATQITTLRMLGYRLEQMG